MRKRLLWVIIFFTALYVGDRLLGSALNIISNKSSFRFSRIYSGSVTANIVIMGNSRGVNSFYQPDLEAALHTSVFNMSYNGLRIDIARMLLEDYLSLNKKPSLIILEASMLTQSFPELVKEFKPYITANNRVGQKMKELYPDIYRYTRISKLFRYNSELFLRSLYYLNHDDQRWINNGIIKDNLKKQLTHYNETKFEINSSLLNDLAAIEKICIEKNIQLKIVLAPYLPAYVPKIINLGEWKKRIDRILKTTQVVDYSTSVNGDAYFADWVHTNKSGSKVLLDSLLKDNFFEE